MKQQFSLSSFNLVRVEVYINNQGPYYMVVDIGARRTVLHPDIAEKLGLEIKEEENQGATAHGAIVHSKAAVLDEFKLGDLIVKNHDVVITEGIKVTGDEIGAIGVNFLRNYYLEVDYKAKEIYLGQSRGTDELHPFFPDKAKANYLLVVNAAINGDHEYPFIIDTGAGGSLINQDVAMDMNLEIRDSPVMIRSPSGTTRAKETTVSSFSTSFGTFEDQSFLLMPLSHLAEGEKNLGGIIGFNYLRDKKLIIDYPNTKFALVDES
ncbi:MAG: aspartyl protease family protein [Candidatus Heimdallarchaeota archaeon]|nr:aspartyl protease family protein [Candidatus Heimdallarchaeota archaeon]